AVNDRKCSGVADTSAVATVAIAARAAVAGPITADRAAGDGQSPTVIDSAAAAAAASEVLAAALEVSVRAVGRPAAGDAHAGDVDRHARRDGEDAEPCASPSAHLEQGRPGAEDGDVTAQIRQRRGEA